MFRPHVEAARCEALFVSSLQSSPQPPAEQVREAVARTIRTHGVLACVARVAQEFGDHPETAVTRMRWAREAVSHAYPAARTQSWSVPAAPARRELLYAV
jgi:hypothetical protein